MYYLYLAKIALIWLIRRPEFLYHWCCYVWLVIIGKKGKSAGHTVNMFTLRFSAIASEQSAPVQNALLINTIENHCLSTGRLREHEQLVLNRARTEQFKDKALFNKYSLILLEGDAVSIVNALHESGCITHALFDALQSRSHPIYVTTNKRLTRYGAVELNLVMLDE